MHEAAPVDGSRLRTRGARAGRRSFLHCMALAGWLAQMSVLAGCGADRRAPVATAIEPGAAVQLPMDERVHPLSEWDLALLVRSPSDRPRIVNFWATWCGPCREELPMLARLAAARPDVDVVLVSVDEPRDSTQIERVLAPIGLRTFLLGPDAAAVLQRVVPGWPGAIPLTLVVDVQGGEVGRVVGAADAAGLTRMLAEMQSAG